MSAQLDTGRWASNIHSSWLRSVECDHGVESSWPQNIRTTGTFRRRRSAPPLRSRICGCTCPNADAGWPVTGGKELSNSGASQDSMCCRMTRQGDMSRMSRYSLGGSRGCV
jgi:hypothetical protein